MIEIRDPKFKVGQKVKCDSNIIDNILTIKSVNRFSFEDGDYFYKANNNRGDYYGIIRESDYEIYIEKPKTVWDLKEGDTYYSIYGNGNVSSEKKWFDDDYEKSYRKIGNTFLTKEEAEFEVERRKVETEMLRLGGRRKFNRGKDNYFIMYTRIEGLDYVNYHSMPEQGVIYFDSDIDVAKAVQEIGEDKIKKYIFGVE